MSSVTVSAKTSRRWANQYEKIKAEGHSGQNLRRARLMAQKHGISYRDDFDAVLQLRRIGLDPFSNATVVKLKTDMADFAPLSASDSQQKNAHFMRTREVIKARRARLLRYFQAFFLYVMLPSLLLGGMFWGIMYDVLR